MIKIQALKVMENHLIKLSFNDGTAKVIDFQPFIGDDKLTKPLADPIFFSQVKTYPNGRGIYWPNDYDFCPDFLYKYVPEVQLARV